MNSLEKLQELASEDIEMLEDAGVRTRAHLSRFTPESLEGILVKNRYNTRGDPPDRKVLQTWIDAARNYNYAPQREQRRRPRLAAPTRELAKPLSPESLQKAGLDIEELPLSLPVEEGSLTRNSKSNYALQSGAAINTGPPGEAKVRLNNRNQRIAKDIETTGVDLRRAPKPESNKGLTPSDPRYLRGILHLRPILMYSSGWLVLTLYITFPLFIASFAYIAIGTGLGVFETVPLWLFFFPALFLMSAILNLFTLPKARCAVCGQNEFLPRQCRRHEHAHKSPFGHAVATATNLIRFHWFRCQFCGTPNRTKE